MIEVVALVAAFALVPAGLLFGIVARILLARRRTWARRNVPAAVDGRAQQARVLSWSVSAAYAVGAVVAVGTTVSTLG